MTNGNEQQKSGQGWSHKYVGLSRNDFNFHDNQKLH